jgi:hypothetical protein
MKWAPLALVILITPAWAGSSFWHPDRFRSQVTEDQITQACAADAQRLCASAMLKGRAAVVSCMAGKRAQIGPACMSLLKAAGK